MTREEERTIQFYRTDAVHTVLKRYEFSEEEKKIIQAAIVTARREKPSMALIEKADALLKNITTNQTPVDNGIDKTEMAKAQARAAIIDTQKKKVRAESSGRDGWSIEFIAITVAIVSLIIYGYIYFTESPNKKNEHLLYTFSAAQAYCQEQGKVLPLTFDDSPDHLQIPDEYNQQGYWRANGGVIYNIVSYGITDKSDGKKHYALCVDKNGKSNAVAY